MDKMDVIIRELTPKRKEKIMKMCDEVIDLLMEKHKLSPMECATVVWFLMKGLSDTGMRIEVR